jgi:hypothetical protein
LDFDFERAGRNVRPFLSARNAGFLHERRRLARDFERTPETFRSLHFLAFAILMLHNFFKSITHIL